MVGCRYHGSYRDRFINGGSAVTVIALQVVFDLSV